MIVVEIARRSGAYVRLYAVLGTEFSSARFPRQQAVVRTSGMIDGQPMAFVPAGAQSPTILVCPVRPKRRSLEMRFVIRKANATAACRSL